MYMLWFNLILNKTWYFLSSGVWYILFKLYMKQKNIQNCIKGKIEPQNIYYKDVAYPEEITKQNKVCTIKKL